MVDDIYREQILDHYSNPRNFGKLEGADVTVRDVNASCGDEIEVSVKFGRKGGRQIIEEVMFCGVGCAVSVASSSMLMEKIRNEKLTIEDVLEMSREDMEEIVGGRVGAARARCLMMGLRGLKKALEPR